MKGAINDKDAQGMSHQKLTHIIGVIFEVGGEIGCGVLEVFVLAAMSFPRVMKRAQKEIESLSGHGKLLTFEDLPSLPYTTVLPNHWAMDMDEEVFENPNEFRPGRWLENPDAPLAAYGFGRRSCPGWHIAQDTLAIVISRVLWGFDIIPMGDVDTLDMVTGLLSPKHFEAQFKVRTPRKRTLLKARGRGWRRILISL